MAKGKKTGGRVKGSVNKTTAAAKSLASQVLTDQLESRLWERFLASADDRVAFDAFKLAKAYKSGQPAKAPEDRSEAQVIYISHIPRPERGS